MKTPKMPRGAGTLAKPVAPAPAPVAKPSAPGRIANLGSWAHAPKRKSSKKA